MKKREIDLFGILLGIVIGCVLGYFVFSRINVVEKDEPVIQKDEFGTVYTIVLGTGNTLDSLTTTIDRLKVLNIYYEIYEENNRYYIFNSTFDDLTKAQTKKAILESYEFNPSIRSDYIIDLPKTVITDSKKYEFYQFVVESLLKSMKNEDFIIDEKYYSEPVDIEVFSSISILQSIKNEEIKLNYQLNTFISLLKKLK